jgi:hypothetical protein
MWMRDYVPFKRVPTEKKLSWKTENYVPEPSEIAWCVLEF